MYKVFRAKIAESTMWSFSIVMLALIRDDQANEERYGAAIEALDAAGKTNSAETLAAANWKQT